MDCPKCFSRTTVYNGYLTDKNIYVRRRKCMICDHRFITAEKILPIEVQGNGKRGGLRKKGESVWEGGV